MKAQYSLGRTGADAEVLGILQGFEKLRRVQAIKEMPAIARKGQDRVFLQTGSNGVGGHLNSQVHSASFHYWGQRLGYRCWDDPQFVKEYLRDNEYARVKSRPRNAKISFANANFNGLKPA